MLGERMGKFNELVSDYNQLAQNEYKFHTNHGVIHLIFKPENLPHLVGFQYLSEAHPILRAFNDVSDSKVTASNVFENLINENVSFESLLFNKKIDPLIECRITEFSYRTIKSLLLNTTLFKFKYDSDKTLNAKAKYVLIEDRKDLFLHLYIGYDHRKRFYFPNSFVPNLSRVPHIERDVLSVHKTEIIDITTQKSTVIDHAKIRDLTKEINLLISHYNKKNELFYNEKSNHYLSDELLIEINALLKMFLCKYQALCKLSEVSDYLLKPSNAKLTAFIELLTENGKI
jgi:hypothetical protein